MRNKAQTATLNRICARYGFNPTSSGPHDIKADGITINVETSASLPATIERLAAVDGPVYVAITNNEGIGYAKQQVEGTRIGLLDPRGSVVLPSGSHVLSDSSL